MLRTLQIGMTASRTHISGTDRYYLSLLRELPAHGIAVRGVVLGDPQALDNPVPNVESFAPEGASRWRRWNGLRRAVARGMNDSDIVVSHGAPHAFPAIDAIARRPLVVHFHGPWALEGRADGISTSKFLARRLQELTVYRRGRRFIVLSQAFGDILCREYGVDPSAVRIIPGGVDFARFATSTTRREARVQLGLPADRPIIVTVRRLVPTKGIEEFIDAIAEVRRAVPDIYAVIAGNGPLAGDLEKRVHERGLDGSVKFAGHVPEELLPRLYRAADAMIVPTQSLEGFGLVVIEALASGTPTLVTPVGGLPDVVRELDPSLIFASRGTADMARGICDAFAGGITLPTDTQCAAYARRFDWPKIAEQVCSVYREVA